MEALKERKKTNPVLFCPAAFVGTGLHSKAIDVMLILGIIFHLCVKLFPEPQWLNLQILRMRAARVSSCPD